MRATALLCLLAFAHCGDPNSAIDDPNADSDNSVDTDGGSIDPSGDAGITTGSDGMSYVGVQVLAALGASAPAMQMHTWNVTSDNQFEGNWLMQTPPENHWGKGYAQLNIPADCTGACDPDFALKPCQSQTDCTAGGECQEVASSVNRAGDPAAKMCRGPSDYVYDEMYKVMISGEKFVDVTSLLPPDGRYVAAMRNAITVLARSGKAVQVRLLFGDYPVQGVVNSKTVLQSLVRDVDPLSNIEVYVGNYRSSDLPPSWNHSKIVAADGKQAIVGGHNLWTQHYTMKNPVHDISMRVQGSAAADAHRFANEQWNYTCANKTALTAVTWSVWLNSFKKGVIAEVCPPAAAPDAPAKAVGSSTMIAVGRLAQIDSTGQSNQSDTAFLAMVGAARQTIRMSLQDLGPAPAPVLGIPIGSWPTELFAKLAVAIANQVDVYIVLSNKGSLAGGLTATDGSYSNGWSAEDVVDHFRAAMMASPPANLVPGTDLNALLCERLHVAPLRFSSEDAFPDGVSYPNHAKFVMVDDLAFYIGSQNQYNAGLTEYGYIVDDQAAAATVARSYWSHLWGQSVRVAVSGSDAKTCH